jgi:hypothetical protein
VAPTIPEPVFPEIPATDPTVVPPVPGATFDQWFLLGCNILSDDGSNFSSESFWVKGNATELSTIRTNNILRNITSVDALVEQLGQEWLDANPDVIEIMPQFLTVLAKIANRQGVL